MKKLLLILLCLPMIGFGQNCHSAKFNLGDRLSLNYPLVSNQPHPLEFAGEMTIEFWIKSSQVNGTPYIFFKDSEDWSSSSHIYGRVQIELSNGFLQAKILAQNPQTFIPNFLVSVNPVADGNWHHIAITRDLNDELKLYVDGLLCDTETGHSGTLASGPNPFSIGWGRSLNNPLGTNFFEGNLDNFRIWNKELSVAEINYYKQECKIIDTDLLFNFDFDEVFNNQYLDQNSNYSIDIQSIFIDSVSPICCDCKIFNSKTNFCIGDNVTLYSESEFSLLWSDGSADTSLSFTALNDTSVQLYFLDSTGTIVCIDSVFIYVNAANVPTVQQVGNNLLSSTANSYQWYLNGILLSGETSQILSIIGDGTYSVEISDDNGCKATSNDFIISTNSINDIKNNIGVKNVYDLMGRSLNQYDRNKIIIIHYNDGTYSRKVILD